MRDYLTVPVTEPFAPETLPDPALVVLVGASGSGKSTWAARHFRAVEIVSSDDLRAVVGSGRHDLEASADAFDLLDRIVAARLGRRLTTVVDTLGLDADRRLAWLALARAHDVAAVVAVMETPVALARAHNAARDRPVPARVLTDQLRRAGTVQEGLAVEGWDRVVTVAWQGSPTYEPPTRTTASERAAQVAPTGSLLDGDGMSVVLQISRFPWGDDPVGWLGDIAHAAADAGFAGLALMDHLIQIPQVDRAWAPIPEPWVTLGMLAGLDTGLHLGTLVTPVTFRRPGITAKAAATLSTLNRGRAFVGVGAGWWQREHAAYGLELPPFRDRINALGVGIETMRALWAPGTRPYDSPRVSLPETTCYPRPAAPIPIILGGKGERTVRLAAELGDACNLPADDALPGRLDAFRRHCAALGTTPSVTVLDTPLVGSDRDEVWRLVERHRGRVSASSYAARHHAGLPGQQAERYRALAGDGVRVVFCAPVGLADPEQVAALSPLARPVG